MKKILITLIILTLVLTGTAYAAGTCTQTRSEQEYRGSIVRIVTISCTADASDGSVPDVTLDRCPEVFAGWQLCQINTIGDNAGTEVTEDSDFYIYQKAGGITKAIDMLDGNGVDALDNSANRSIHPAIGGTAACIPVINAITISTSGNSVNSATFKYELIFTP